MHRKRPRLRRSLAGLASALFASASLALVATQTLAAPAADDAAAAADQFHQVTLAKGNWETGEPMSLAVTPDGDVLHTSREGTLRLTNAAGETKFSGQLDVYTHDEEGLQGVGVDPDFKNNRAVYLYYAPPLDTPEGEAPKQGSAKDFEPFETDKGYRLSRFVLKKDGTLDKGSEKKVLDVPASRGECCHVGGDIDFDKQGNLYLSTGDDTSSKQSDGYTPIDERGNRNPSFDAQRTSGNTNDLRGKILRIKVADDGSYTIPKGNLFDEKKDSKKETRPEIYAMGLRNPFRLSVDQQTGFVYVGENDADASSGNPKRGPAGLSEFNRITGPGNYGWPYCVGKNQAYVDYNFADKTSSKAFDCKAPTNDSPRNTGQKKLPPAQPAWIAYDGSVPGIGKAGKDSPLGGPVYRYDKNLKSEVKFPEDLDGDFFAGDFSKRWIKTVEQDNGGKVQSIKDFPWAGTELIDMDFGPDGALYVLDYGLKWFGGDHNSALYRVENTAKGHTPDARAKVDKKEGKAPLKVSFSSEGTKDGDGDKLTYAWDFGDGGTSTEPNPRHTYQKNGIYTAQVTVKDDTGRANSASLRVTVPTAPTLKLTLPSDGKLSEFGDEIPFKVETTGTEDEQTRCSKVEVNYVLGHDDHGHPMTAAKGCKGTLKPPTDTGHDHSANVYGGVAARYNFKLKSGEPYISDKTMDTARLNPRHWQAEHFTPDDRDEGFKGSHDVKVADHAAAHGGRTVGSINNGSWVAYKPYDLGNATKLTARVSSAGPGGTLEVRSGAPDGKLLGSAKVPVTGSWEKFTDVSTNLTDPPAGTTTLYLVFKGADGKHLFDVDDFMIDTSTQGAGMVEQGYSSLFDGSGTDGWKQAGPGSFALDKAAGTLKSVGGMGLLWYEKKQFNSYSLKLDWKTSDKADNSGVFLGFPDPKNDPWKPVTQGYEIQINDRKDPKGSTGSVYTFQAADIAKRDAALKPPGQWNTYEIRVEGEHLQVFLNGVKINDFRNADPARSLKDGHIGIQNHGAGDEVYYRDIRVKELPADGGQGYSSLFGGSGTDGWKQAGPGSFALDKAAGTLKSVGGMGLLWYEKKRFNSYSLKLDWKVAGDDDSGVFVGFPDPGNDPWSAVKKGYEVQIDASDIPKKATGAVYDAKAPDIAKRDSALKPPGQWNTYEIRVEGEHLQVFLNGVKINDFTNTAPARSLKDGYIGIQNYGAGDEVSFRNIQVKELPAGRGV